MAARLGAGGCSPNWDFGGVVKGGEEVVGVKDLVRH